MSIFDTVKGLILEEEEVEEPGAASPPAIIKTTAAVRETKEDSPSARSLAGRVLDPKNNSGAAYIKFVDLRKALDNIIQDPRQRLQVALATSQTLGISVQDILTAINRHIERLEEEKRIFGNSAQTNADREINEKSNQVAFLDKNILDTQAEIDKLQKEVLKLTANKQTAEVEVATKRKEIEQIKLDFAAAVDTLFRQLDSDRQQLTPPKV